MLIAPSAENLLADSSPLVRGMAVWALSRLVDQSVFAGVRDNYLPFERDTDVQDEWSRIATEGAE